MILLTILGFLILGVCVAGFWKMTQGTAQSSDLIEEHAKLKAELEGKLKEIGTVRNELEAERTQKNELQGKNKVLYSNGVKLEAHVESLTTECDRIKKQLTKFEAESKQRDKEFSDRVKSLETAENSLKEERKRVIQEDEERRKKELEDKDREWNEHEVGVIAQLSDLCKQPQFNFTSFTNDNLPMEFSGNLKPDFMIEFLGQYIIFDAKVSKAKNLQAYINDTTKKTAEKVKKNNKIFPVIFLVVPTSTIAELSRTYYAEAECSFYVISPEAVPPILWSLKRITHYELAEKMDPQQRENIINLIADLDYHINWRNAMDIVMTKFGTDLLQRVQKLDPEIAAQVEQKKLEKKPSVPSQSELKRLVMSIAMQNEEIEQLASPKSAVNPQDIRILESAVKQRLFEG